MFTFHKPKVFRSVSGCCICKAKSSSSRFTDSKRYEHVFERCFDLSAEENDRSGEICNACVLLVKRFLKLPEGSTRNWNHVVDARSGPGIKSLAKKKSGHARNGNNGRSTPDNTLNQLDSMTPEKVLKKKHVYRSKNKRTPAAAPIRQRTPSSASLAVSEFLDSNLWTREKICCGTIFRGPFGETVVDVSFLTPCSGRTTGSNGLRCLTSEMEAAKRLSEEVASAAQQHAEVATATKVAAGDAADDEGFFDKNVASPSESSLSARSDVCSGASESGTTSPPPNVEEEEEEEEEMMEEDEESEEEIDDVEEAT